MERLFGDLKRLRDLADRLPGLQHRIRFPKLPVDLLRRVSFSFPDSLPPDRAVETLIPPGPGSGGHATIVRWRDGLCPVRTVPA